jgi:hypothetical protein
MAAWKRTASSASWLRWMSRVGVRSAPPPNQLWVVAMKRVFMWTAGTRGLTMWAIRLMPVATKRGSSSAPGMVAAISGVKVPCTRLMWTPHFSKKRPPRMKPITPPPPAGRSQGFSSKRPGAPG